MMILNNDDDDDLAATQYEGRLACVAEVGSLSRMADCRTGKFRCPLRARTG